MQRENLSPDTVTELLHSWNRGSPDAANRLLPLIYDELKQVAGRAFHSANWQHTLDTTELVHETFLRLSDQGVLSFEHRRHFFGVASRLMRQILVDSIRRRLSAKRGGGADQIPLDQVAEPALGRAAEILALDQALVDLAAVDQRKAAVVELRFFGGLTLEQISDELGIAPATVHREWRRARAWLANELIEGPIDDGS